MENIEWVTEGKCEAGYQSICKDVGTWCMDPFILDIYAEIEWSFLCNACYNAKLDDI